MKTGRWMHVVIAVAAAAAVMMSAFLAGCGSSSSDSSSGGLDLPTEIKLVSNTADGVQGDGNSSASSISADGRYVVFSSAAANLVAGDTNGQNDVFIRDLVADTITLISNAADGTEANGFSTIPSISADGRYVVFYSAATNLVAGDTNGSWDIFVRDLQTGAVQLVSNAADGAESNGYSLNPMISADGRYVAFASDATNLVAGSTNGLNQIFVRDLQAGTMQLISNAADGSDGDDYSYDPKISADGRYVVFYSYSTNLVAGDTNGLRDIFACDLQAGTIKLISNAADGAEADDYSVSPKISADGRYVVFMSAATNLVSDDTNGVKDVFMRDLQTDAVTLISKAADGTVSDNSSYYPAISADNRYVAFNSWATTFVAGDTNGTSDIFVRDLQTGAIQLISKAADGTASDASASIPTISADGRYVAFYSAATNLVAGDTNGFKDVFFAPVQW